MERPVDFAAVKAAEAEAIKKRRSQHVASENPDGNAERPVGLAISGGGVRSASFSLGVIQALDEHGRFGDVDYLSTVSGGSFIGGYVATLALDSAVHRKPPDAVPTGAESQGPAAGPPVPGNGQAAGSPANGAKRTRHPITPLVRHEGAPSDHQNAPQNERVRRLVYSGDYLRSPLRFLNRYVFGLILINTFAFSGLLAVAAFLAWAFRELDTPDAKAWISIFGFDSDLTRAFFPSFLITLFWIVAWVLSKWLPTARKASTLLFGLLAASVLIAFAALLGTGDIQVTQIVSLLGLQPTSEELNSVAGVLRILLIAPLIALIIPYLNPRRFLRSGHSPQASFLERMTFRVVTCVLLVGIPLFVFGYLARENVSGQNERRNGSFYPVEIGRGEVGHDWDAFWQRLQSESERSRTMMPDLLALRRPADDNPLSTGSPLRRFHASIRALSGNQEMRIRAACDGHDPRPANVPNQTVAEATPPLPGELQLRTFLLSSHWNGTEFLSRQLWTSRGSIADAVERHGSRVDIPADQAGIEELLRGRSIRLHGDEMRVRHRQPPKEQEIAEELLKSLKCWKASNPPRDSIPPNATLRLARKLKMMELAGLQRTANPHFYSPWTLGLEAVVSQFNTKEPEPEEIVRLHDLQLQIYVIQVLMAENLNAALRQDELVNVIPLDWMLDEEAQSSIRRNFPGERIEKLRIRLEAAGADRRTVIALNRELLNTVYADYLQPRSKIYGIVVLDRDQAFRVNYIWATAAIFLIAGLLVNLRATSPHAYYRTQLRETWLSDQAAFQGDIPLTRVNTTSEGYPYHLIDATANIGRAIDSQDELGATGLFILSRLYCGSDRTGYLATNSYAGGNYDLASAMAVSAGAVSPARVKGLFVKLMAALLNLRLGEWLPNPGYEPRRFGRLRRFLGRWPAPFFVAPSALKAAEPSETAFCFITDGGHFENLGMSALLKRRCHLIVCVDASLDPAYEFFDFSAMERKMRVDEGIEFSRIMFDGSKPPAGWDDLVPPYVTESGPGAVDDPARTTAPPPRSLLKLKAEKHYAVFQILYPEGGTGYCVYLKPGFDGNENRDLISYAAEDPSFPHDPTADQFFEPNKFESYRQLGYHIGKTVCKDLFDAFDGPLWEWEAAERHFGALAASRSSSSILDAMHALFELHQRKPLDATALRAFTASIRRQFERLIADKDWPTLQQLDAELTSQGTAVLKALGEDLQASWLDLLETAGDETELTDLRVRAADSLNGTGVVGALRARASRILGEIADNAGQPEALRQSAARLVKRLRPRRARRGKPEQQSGPGGDDAGQPVGDV
jgi:Patatin-like phospholipase